jgi:hypothetical protein
MVAQERPRYRWVWFFLVLGVLTAGGIAANVWFNLQQQLTPEQLADARRVWEESGPADYRLDYSIKREVNPDLAGTVPENYSVEVRGKKMIAVTTPEGRLLKPGDVEFDTMDSLFAAIGRQLSADSEPNRPRAFVKATFDGRDGHVKHYVHSVMRTRERLEVTVQLTPEAGGS